MNTSDIFHNFKDNCCETLEFYKSIFNGLSAEGQVTMPMADTFWSSYFGMFTDKFGINWMVSYAPPE